MLLLLKAIPDAAPSILCSTGGCAWDQPPWLCIVSIRAALAFTSPLEVLWCSKTFPEQSVQEGPLPQFYHLF